MDPHDFDRPPTTAEIVDEWSETNPAIRPSTPDDWSTMIARKMEKYPREKKARRLYYDLFEFRCR